MNTPDFLKTLSALCLCAAAASAFASAPEDELLSAQAAYRDTLKAQTHNSRRIASLQAELEQAKIRLQSAQADISRLETELQNETAEQSRHNSALQAAGARLDAAWKASRNAPRP
ncbi:hypothetical protein [Neisseria weaveri]|uniref:Periplasmic protein n=1 Tax=Neisseria weaveri TaxID=28091 RepID=A0A448VNG4_9NEIS|nr:hypothetical protein [Neisseria weaveri]EGV35157.1 hypothetical protein l11_21630 [Neisseria weaveri LMG 5135]EGV36173.1 hypothetical protein l13_09310 [Neisseria weaveri ATCC 51223]SAY51904.1 Putative periplasmic protein [Neisseria weaveri]VEJ51320.1 Putative periplasmic protein [Neisseria weaveri]